MFGGSFDPVHEGHLRSADELHKLLPDAQVFLLPAARSPLKNSTTADHHRLAMLQLALQDYPGLQLDDRELHRPPPSYSIDTLRELRADVGDAESLVWVIGADTLADLARWKDWQALTTLAHLLVIDRPGNQWPNSGPVAEWLDALPTVKEANQLQCRPHGWLAQIALTPQPFSSTAIRCALAARVPDSPKPQGLADSVWQYIIDNHLYLV